MPIYNKKLQKQNEILSTVAEYIGFNHYLSGSLPSLKDYNEELSRYIWTLNLLDLRNSES